MAGDIAGGFGMPAELIVEDTYGFDNDEQTGDAIDDGYMDINTVVELEDADGVYDMATMNQ